MDTDTLCSNSLDSLDNIDANMNIAHASNRLAKKNNTVKLLIEPHVNVKILLKIEFKSDFFERALFG